MFIVEDSETGEVFRASTAREVAERLGIIDRDGVAMVLWSVLHKTLIHKRYRITEIKKKASPKRNPTDKYEHGINVTNLNKGYIPIKK